MVRILGPITHGPQRLFPTRPDVAALIGEGGRGQVYQATDTKLNRQVALKIIPEAVASDPDCSDGGVCLTGTPCPESRVLRH